MKQRKSWLCGLLALVLVVGLLPVTAHAASGSWGDNITWELEGTTLTLSGHGDMMPADYIFDDNGLFVAPNTPWYGLNVTELVVEDSISSIGQMAFMGMTRLETVTLPDSVTYLDANAFSGCTALESIHLPAYLTDIGAFAFENCVSLSGTLELPSMVRCIEYAAFYGCESLTELVLPEGLLVLDLEALRYSGIETITIPASVAEISMLALANCPNLTDIQVAADNPYYTTDSQGALYSRDMVSLLCIPGGFDGDFVIPEGITYAETGWSYGCHAMSGLHIPASLEEFASDELGDCENLVTITVAEGNPTYWTDDEGLLYGKCLIPNAQNQFVTADALLRVPSLYAAETEFHVPATVGMLGESAFRHCAYLTDIHIPAGTEEVYPGTFYGCESLTGIWFAEGHPWFRSDDEGVVFSTDGQYLEFFPTGRSGYYAIPEGVVELSGYAFGGGAIESVVFPEDFEAIGFWPFEGCENLTDLLFLGDMPLAVFFDSMAGVTANVHYPDWLGSWANPDLGGGNLTFIPYSRGNVPTLPGQPTEPEPHEHSYTAVVTAPTCTERGYTTHTCGCGHSYRDSYVEALGHDWKGLECTRCDAVRENPFSDVNPKHWYVDAVLWAVDEGITNGIGGGKFGTMDICLRSEFVTFLWRVYDQPEPASSAIPFKDVKKNQWYTKPVLWAVEKGITNGSGNGMFGTEDNCLRSEIVTFLWRAAGSPKPTTTRIPFQDVKPNMWYTDAVLWAVENGITNGISATEFGTEENCLRCDVVTFLYRVYGE